MNLNLIAPINDLGYGITGKHLTHELVKLGVNVSLFPISTPQIRKEDKCLPNIQTAINNAAMPDFNAPCIRLWHQFEMSQMVGKGEHIAFPIFELDTLTEREKHHLSSQDRIFVCSEWAADVVKENLGWGDMCVHVIPLGVDLDIFKPTTVDTGTETRFFNCGKTEVRKGHDILGKVFNQAFTPDDDVHLYMMWDNPFLDDLEKDEWVRSYMRTPLGKAGKITFLPRVETSQEVAQVMSQMDSGVFLSRGEGWNLEALEMLALGKEIIITNYSAHTEFCNEDNSLLVKIDELEDAYDGKWFHGDGKWAKLGDGEIQQAIMHMRWMHSDKQSNHPISKLFNLEGVDTASQFTWENSAKKIIECL